MQGCRSGQDPLTYAHPGIIGDRRLRLSHTNSAHEECSEPSADVDRDDRRFTIMAWRLKQLTP